MIIIPIANNTATMKSQIFLIAILVGVILVAAEEKSNAKAIEQTANKKHKRGLVDLGEEYSFDFFDNHGIEDQHHGLNEHHQEDHISHDIKEIKVPIPAPYPVHIERKVPFLYPVKVPVHVANPVPVPVIKPYPVHVEKRVPYPVVKHIPVPVKVPVKVPYPVHVPVHVERPYPVPVVKNVPYLVKKPYIVEKEVPYFVKEQQHEGFGHGFASSHHF